MNYQRKFMSYRRNIDEEMEQAKRDAAMGHSGARQKFHHLRRRGMGNPQIVISVTSLGLPDPNNLDPGDLAQWCEQHTFPPEHYANLWELFTSYAEPVGGDMDWIVPSSLRGPHGGSNGFIFPVIQWPYVPRVGEEIIFSPEDQEYVDFGMSDEGPWGATPNLIFTVEKISHFVKSNVILVIASLKLEWT